MPTFDLTAVRRVVVLRALMLGDVLCAVPALRALKAALPRATLTLVGLPWAAALASRLPCVDDFITLPGAPGLPETEPHVHALPALLQQLQNRRFDLAVQLHGSGEITNPLVAAFGATHMAGFAGAHAWRPEADAALFAPWPAHGHEIDRLLGLIDHLGLPRQGRHLEFPVTPADCAALAACWPAWRSHSERPYVCVHAGAQLPSRRWPAERFAAVADALADRGHTVVLTGTAPEAAVVAAVRDAMRAPAIDLCGRLTLGMLGALLARAHALISNDTGVSHIAAALRTPSVIAACGSDPQRWAPLDRQRHRTIAHAMPCRPCSHRECPVGHGCALAVQPDHVLRQFDALGEADIPASPHTRHVDTRPAHRALS